MKRRDDIRIGDPVEVRFMSRLPLKPSDMYKTNEEWRPGTVCSWSGTQIGVAFADGYRASFPLYSKEWRPACEQPDHAWDDLFNELRVDNPDA